jgi:predicted ATPase/DNA-binding CsgD family transcriptional regulator
MSTLKTKTHSNNLHTPLSIFIGREREIAEVKQRLFSNRLVTITGPGGSGKTRLALQVADELLPEFEDGIWLIEFAPLADGAFAPQAVASGVGVSEQPGRTLIDTLVNRFFNLHSLLLFDNCEHLIGACAQLADSLLKACPDLSILATSRETLDVVGEAVFIVPPLSLPEPQPWRSPDSAQDALLAYQQSEAVRLFAERAKIVSTAFELTAENGMWVADICRRLDGMPLAIELAAVRVRALSVQQIAEHLDDRFHLLTSGSRTAPLRQQTLAATLDWSYVLLSEVEQKVLQRLSVFAGGCTLEAAEVVCAGNGVETAEVMDALSNLVDKSLLLVDKADHKTRYRLLETIRQYAREKLTETDEVDESKTRHLNYFVQWAENTESSLNKADQMLWPERYEAEHDNLHAALDWSMTSESKFDLGLRLATCLVGFWHTRGYYNEGRIQLSAFLEKTKTYDKKEVRAKILEQIGGLAFVQTDYPATRLWVEESLTIYRELGAEGRLGVANSLITLGDLSRQSGSYETAFSLLEEALRLMRELNDPSGIVHALWQLGYYFVSRGDYPQAERYFTEALPLSRQIADEYHKTVILSGLGESAVRQGDFGRAAEFEEEGLMLRRKIGDKWGIAVSLANFAWIELHQDNLGKAESLLLESFTIRREIEDRGGMAWCLEKLAKINILYGQKKPRTQSIENFRHAAQLLGAAAALRAPVGSVIDQADQPEYERDLETLRSALGKEAFSNLWLEGEGIPLSEVVDGAWAESTKESIQSEKEKSGGLTARERQVAILISQGKSNREIANAMTVGVRTIETYVTRIMNKLGFDSRVQIATWAIERGLYKKESQ